MCYKQKRDAKDAIGRLAQRRAEIFQSPEGHLRDRRWGDGRISSLSMSEQQTVLEFLYDVSEIRDEKVNFNPGSETDQPNKSVTSAHTPARNPQRTR